MQRNLVVLPVWPKHWGTILMTRRNVSPSVDFAPSAGRGGGVGLLQLSSVFPSLFWWRRVEGVWVKPPSDWLGFHSGVADTHSTPWHFSKVTAVTGALWAAAAISRFSLQIAGEWASRVPLSHAPDSECKCLLCRSDAGRVLGALVETHFIVNRTVSGTFWAWPW